MQPSSAASGDIPSTSTALSPPIKKGSLSNPLKQLALPYQKRYAGHPRKNGKGYFLEYNKSPKIVSKKSLIEKQKSKNQNFQQFLLSVIVISFSISVPVMDNWISKGTFYNWFWKENCRGRINVIQADVSNAVTEDVVEKELECFQSLFTPDDWAAVLQTSKFLFHFICILSSYWHFILVDVKKNRRSQKYFRVRNAMRIF